MFRGIARAYGRCATPSPSPRGSASSALLLDAARKALCRTSDSSAVPLGISRCGTPLASRLGTIPRPWRGPTRRTLAQRDAADLVELEPAPS